MYLSVSHDEGSMMASSNIGPEHTVQPHLSTTLALFQLHHWAKGCQPPPPPRRQRKMSNCVLHPTPIRRSSLFPHGGRGGRHWLKWSGRRAWASHMHRFRPGATVGFDDNSVCPFAPTQVLSSPPPSSNAGPFNTSETSPNRAASKSPASAKENEEFKIKKEWPRGETTLAGGVGAETCSCR